MESSSRSTKLIHLSSSKNYNNINHLSRSISILAHVKTTIHPPLSSLHFISPLWRASSELFSLISADFVSYESELKGIRCTPTNKFIVISCFANRISRKDEEEAFEIICLSDFG